MAEARYSAALQEIILTFQDATAEERLDMLVEYACDLPELPAGLSHARMEQVQECQSPVFLLAEVRDGKIYYYLDVPPEAPAVRGFASILHEGLNGATPEEIAATPPDLYQQLGLHSILSPLRLRGLMGLLQRMKRQAQELARPDCGPVS